MKIYKTISYATLVFGLIGIIYGFSEYMYALKSVQYLLGNMIKGNQQLFTDPAFQAFINISIGQATAMKVLAYIAPGFILSALAIIMILLSEVICHLRGMEQITSAITENLMEVFKEDEVIELKDEVKKEG
jgi:hypothetical protein